MRGEGKGEETEELGEYFLQTGVLSSLCGWLVALVGKCFYLDVVSHYNGGNWRNPPDCLPCELISIHHNTAQQSRAR